MIGFAKAEPDGILSCPAGRAVITHAPAVRSGQPAQQPAASIAPAIAVWGLRKAVTVPTLTL
jgi:hypothetical protein